MAKLLAALKRTGFFRRLNSLSILSKILGLIAFLVLLLVCSSYFLQKALQGNAQLIMQQSRIINLLSEINYASQEYGQLRWSFLSFLNQPSPSYHEEVRTSLMVMNNTLASIYNIPQLNDTEELELRIARLSEISESYDYGQFEQARREELTAEVISHLGRIDTILNDMASASKIQLDRLAERTMKNTNDLRRIPLIFIIGGMLTVIFVVLVVFVNIFIPISKITRAMVVASRDTENARSYVLPVRQHDEVGRTALALNRLLMEVSFGIEKLRRTETKLRDAGQYLQATLDNVVDGIVIINHLGIIETFSPGAEKILGYSADELLDSDFSVLEVQDSNGISQRIRDKQLPLSPMGETPRSKEDGRNRQGDHYAPYETTLCHKDGHHIPVEIAIGEAIHAGKDIHILTIRDISTRKEMEAMLRQAQRMETIGAMGGGIAHDFNNMLIVISGNLELIERRTRDDPVLQEMVANGLDSVERGKELTQRLLAFSRKQVLMPRTININEHLDEIISLMRRAVPDQIEIVSKTQSDLWDIHVDVVQLESAMLNLAINARDAINGKGKILIETKNIFLDSKKHSNYASAAPGPYVMLSLSDTGSGIAPENLDRVFDPFFTTKEVGKGTGLGLSMVYGFTRQSGGYVLLKSKVGRGTTIQLFFPRAEESKDNSEDATADHKPYDEAAWQVTGGTETLLVAEDKPEVLAFLARTLRELGYTVIEATNARSALEKLSSQNEPLDMLITDVVMPGELNGEELAEQAQAQYPDLKVLYISGYTKDALVDQGALKPGVKLLRKPFSSKKLAYLVRQILDEQVQDSNGNV